MKGASAELIEQTLATQQTATELKTSEIIFREDLYPRIEKSPITVQKYAEDLSVLPPIEINQHNEIIDGWHRWTAHKKKGAETIRVFLTKTTNDGELLELAIERNATHGLQLSQADKRDMARKIYSATPLEEQGPKKEKLAEILSVTLQSVRSWLSRIDKDNKEERDCAVRNLWLSCHTQDEIAEAVGIKQTRINEILSETKNFSFPIKVGDLEEIEDEKKREDALEKRNRDLAEHCVDFSPPIYNIWKQQEKTNGSEHFGNSEIRWLDNLLYLYTKPFDVVIDPFAGSGSTIELCRKRLRRYFVSDRKPIIEREKEIRKHDLIDGLPKPPQWKDVKLVYLDPPYWKQAEREYSDDPTDLSNMPLEEFNDRLAGIINGFAKKLSDSYIALIIQPTQWNAPERQYTDHIGDMLRTVKLHVDMRFSVPYESQQCNAQMVEWAKANKRCLVLTREIVVWRIE
jgi:DNA modification methylase